MTAVKSESHNQEKSQETIVRWRYGLYGEGVTRDVLAWNVGGITFDCSHKVVSYCIYTVNPDCINTALLYWVTTLYCLIGGINPESSVLDWPAIQAV